MTRTEWPDEDKKRRVPVFRILSGLLLNELSISFCNAVVDRPEGRRYGKANSCLSEQFKHLAWTAYTANHWRNSLLRVIINI